jgi:aspartyl-tRNA(Asn)/glutamyl-tRNA(Gln) amidotransferase subunit A
MRAMDTTPVEWRSIARLARDFRSGALSPLELTRHLLSRIAAQDRRAHAFRLVCPDRALAEAGAAEAQLRAGQDRGPLHGVPFVAKDLFDVRGLPTTAGTRLLESNVAAEDATAVARLAAAGMVLLGKTHTVQLAYGGAGINHDQGTPSNPWHPVPHLPGGSSSGTAVAIAAGFAPAGLGTDTGGSVRIPASFCGISGLKTTRGLISRAGVWPLSFSLDTVGPMARSVEDLALVHHALEGPDPRDPSLICRPSQDVVRTLDVGVRELRLAFAETVFWDDADPEVVDAVRACGRVFQDLGARVGHVDLPEADEARRLNPRGLIIAAEAYTLNRRLLDEHFDELDPVVASRMIAGRDVAAHDYLATLLAWQRLRAEAAHRLRDVDALLCPTTMIAARPVGEGEAGLEAYAALNLNCLRNTAIGNILDLCGVSVPCGFTREGLPIGLTIYGKPFDEATVLRAGHAFQQATDWHRRIPSARSTP